MAKIQSRRTVSLNRPLFNAARLHAAALGKPLAGWVAELLQHELATAGVDVPVPATRPRLSTAGAPQHEWPAVVVTAVTAPPQEANRQLVRSGTCAVCTKYAAEGDGGWATVGIGDALYRICSNCESEHPRQGRYSFSEGRSTAPARPSIGAGNRRKGAA